MSYETDMQEGVAFFDAWNKTAKQLDPSFIGFLPQLMSEFSNDEAAMHSAICVLMYVMQDLAEALECPPKVLWAVIPTAMQMEANKEGLN